MCWDCVGAVITEKFNYATEPYLARFFLEYCAFKPEKRGFDPSVWPLTTKECKTLKDLDCSDDLKIRNPHHREFHMMMIPDRDDTTEHAFLISYPPRYTYRSPFGRDTRPIRAYDMEKKKIVFVKDYWRPDVQDIDMTSTDLSRKRRFHTSPHSAWGTMSGILRRVFKIFTFALGPVIPTNFVDSICIGCRWRSLGTVW
jgi:hypothetical protein